MFAGRAPVSAGKVRDFEPGLDKGVRLVAHCRVIPEPPHGIHADDGCLRGGLGFLLDEGCEASTQQAHRLADAVVVRDDHQPSLLVAPDVSRSHERTLAMSSV
jgi:hypothetical protein